MSTSSLWRGLNAGAQAQMQIRDYTVATLAQRLESSGVQVGELSGGPTVELRESWIPGVEIFPRTIWQQQQRGWFGEFARQNDPNSILTKLGLWPRQWATALMFAQSAKGFHIHPPFIPEGEPPEAWFQRVFLAAPVDYSLRPYHREQWDVMFFLQGTCEMFLLDERAGLPRRRMRFVIEGDSRPGRNNAGVVIPAGVAHAIRSVSSADLIMVYGTSTQFVPEHEGRLHCGVETAALPEEWARYFSG